MRAFLRCFALLLLLPECGGSPPSAGPKSAASDAPASTSASKREASDTAEDPAPGASSEASPGPSCDDGTCMPCGSGICPSGWYCDEKASACSWLAECADKPSCKCITRVLGPSCKCEAVSGGSKVACD